MDENAYPLRHDSHVTDSAAKSIFRSTLPPEWMLRELSENDYGIDFQLEFTTADFRVTGQFAGIQLKGTSTGNMSIQGSHSISVNRRTLRLWRSYDAPVLLILVDTLSRMVYLKSIEHEIRRDPKRFILGTSNTINFTFTSADQFSSSKALISYTEGKVLRRMDLDLPSVIQIHRDFVKLFWRYRRDGHMAVDDEGPFDVENIGKHKYERQLRNVYLRMQTLSQLLGVGWDLLTVDEIIRIERWYKSDGDEMMEHHFTSILDKLDVQFQNIYAELQRIIADFKLFWEMNDLELVHFALDPIPMMSKLTWNERQKYLYD
jgi:hypothetical protein